MKFTKLIYRNLFRNKTRSIMTALLMAAIFFFVATLLAILRNFDEVAESGEGTNRIVVQSGISLANPLPLAYEQKLRQLPGVADVGKLQWIGGYYKEPKNFFANFAVDHENVESIFDDYKTTPEQLAAFKADRQGALVGKELMKRFGWKLGDRITLKSTIFPMNPELTIRAVYDHSIDPSSLMFHWDYFYPVMEKQGMPGPGTYWIKVKDRSQMSALSLQIDAMFKNSENPTETFTEKQFQQSFLAMIGNVKLLFNAICLCAIFMVVLLAAITMSMTARERVTEIAVLKAIGFERGLILGLLITEFILLTVIGGALGTFGAQLVYRVVNMTKVTQGFLISFGIQPQTIAICLAASAIVGILAGGLPAMRSANLRVVDGLRRIV